MKEPYKIFDVRDEGKDRELAFHTWTQKGFPWNRYVERSLSGFTESHEDAMKDLIKRTKKAKEKIAAICYHNYAVSLIVEIPQKTNE